MKSFRSLVVAMSTAVTLSLAANVATAAEAAKMDVVDTAVAAGSFKTLVSLIKQAGLVETLKGKGPFTVFAPTDEAFAKLPKEALEALGKDKARLAAVLTYHVVPARVLAKDVKPGNAMTVNGQDVRLETAGGVTVNGAKVIKADVIATNGVIHVIDTVIVPR